MPWLVLSETLPVPATMLPAPFKLPVARLIEMSPLLVVTLVPTASRLLASLMVSVCPLPVMLATSVETLVLSAEEFCAEMLSSPPVT